MAHVYTLTEYGKPTLALSLEAGGSLPVGVTLYYRVATCSSLYPGSAQVKSPASDVQSITTDAVNRSVKLTVVHSTGNAEYTQVWCSPGVDPGAGNWLDRDTYPDIVYLSNGSTNQTTITGGKLTEVVDDGATYGWPSNIYTIETTNYGFSPLYENGKALLTCSGGTDVDPISFDTIYAEALAQGWNLAATIERLTIEPSYTGLLNTVGYALNFNYLDVADYFEDKDKLIVVSDCTLNLKGPTTLGRYFEDRDLTIEGVTFIITGHGNSYGRVYVQTGDNEARFYDCECLSKRASYSQANSYSARFLMNGNDWQLIDFKCKGGPSPGLNNGFEVSAATPACLMKRCSFGYHRYAGYWTSAQPFTIEDSVVNPYNGTGIRWNHADPNERTATGLKIPNKVGDDPLYIMRKSDNYSWYSMLAFIDSEVNDLGTILWYGATEKPWTPEQGGSYADLRYTVNVKAIDGNADPVVGATVSMVNGLGAEVFSVVTAADGTITEQVATALRNVPDPDSVERSYWGGILTDFNPFTLTIEADGFQTYTSEFDITEAVNDVIGLLGAVSLDNHVNLVAVDLEPDLEVDLEGDLAVEVESDATVTIENNAGVQT